MAKPRGLGKGLDLMIPNVVGEEKKEKEKEVKVEKIESDKQETLVKITMVEPNREQPRKHFDEDALLELSESIKQFGLIQPILVQDRKTYYEIIAGERRWRASKLAGLKKVPVIIKNYTEQEIVEISLIENIQREDLNPIDEANSVLSIIKLRGMTQDEFATMFGKSRTYITNLLGLLKLPEDIQKRLIKKEISASHARVLSKLDNPEQVRDLTDKIVKEKINVRELEELVNNVDIPKRQPMTTTVNRARSSMRIYESAFSDKIGNKVKINNSKIEIYYNSIKDLERIMNILDVTLGDE